jgi:hypothetical protein
MPPISEKQSQWLMICKCGAKVKTHLGKPPERHSLAAKLGVEPI